MAYNRDEIVADYHLLLSRLAELQREKLNDYGIGRYNMMDNEMSILLSLSDIFRKRIRIEPMLRERLKPGVVVTVPDISLRQNLLDLASYCLMIFQVGEKEKWL